MPDTVRIDRWLWAVRLFKTRSQASTACRLNQVKIDGQFAKPARTIAVGATIEIERDQFTKTVRVRGLVESRVGAKLVPDLLDDITPEEEIERSRAAREQTQLNRVFRVPGEGRPSKKRRRETEKFLGEVEDSNQS